MIVDIQMDFFQAYHWNARVLIFCPRTSPKLSHSGSSLPSNNRLDEAHKKRNGPGCRPFVLPCSLRQWGYGADKPFWQPSPVVFPEMWCWWDSGIYMCVCIYCRVKCSYVMGWLCLVVKSQSKKDWSNLHVMLSSLSERPGTTAALPFTMKNLWACIISSCRSMSDICFEYQVLSQLLFPSN